MATAVLLWTISGATFAQQMQPTQQTPTTQTQQEQRAENMGASRIRGRVLGADGKKGVSGVTVVAYHLSSEKIFTSTPTDAGGNFSIEELPYGYFDVAVRTADGLYVADQVVNVPPSGKAQFKMLLSPGGTDESAPRGFPGTDESPTGVARVDMAQTSKEFLKSPGGIAIIAGGGAALLVWLATSGAEDEPVASPTTP